MNKNKNISDFRIPQGYFDQIEDQIINRLQNNGTNTKGIPKDDGFRVPTDYFKNFESNTANKTKIFKSNKRTRWLPYAAAILVLATLSRFIWGGSNPQEVNFTNLTTEEVSVYIEWYATEIETEVVIELAQSDKDLDLLSFDTLKSDDEILDYLETYDVELNAYYDDF